jgi:spermidine synthase
MTPPERKETHQAEEITLSDGTTARLVTTKDGAALQIGETRQSHVGPPGHPPVLATIRWMHAAVGARPLRVLHLGGGLLTLPRAIADRAPESRQHVIELEPALVDLARNRFGLPEGVTIETGDARAWLESAPAGEWDAVVIDVFAGGRIPPAFSSRECFAHARRALTARGRLILNSVAGPDLTFTRRELATLQTQFEHVAMIVQGSSLAGARFGNAVLIGSNAPCKADDLRAALKGDASKGALVTDFVPIIDGAEPLNDADQLWSPVPELSDGSSQSAST